MLILNLKNVMDDKGIDNPHLYLRQNGFTLHTVSRLMTHTKIGLSFRHLEQLCLCLNCLPSDLFVWKPTASDKVSKDHPLNKLIPPPDKISFTKKLRALPADKLEQIRKFVDDMEKEK